MKSGRRVLNSMGKTTYQKTFITKLTFTVESPAPLTHLTAERAIDILNQLWESGSLKLVSMSPELKLLNFGVGTIITAPEDKSRAADGPLTRIEGKLDKLMEIVTEARSG